MATKNILFFMKIPEKGKKLSAPRMLKRYHREPPSVNAILIIGHHSDSFIDNNNN